MRTRTLLLAALALAGLAIGQANADTLRGVVIGANNAPKPGVAIDVLGPTRVFTETGPDGRFSVEVAAGTYTVRVRDGSRRMEFPGVVPSEAEVQLSVNW